MGPPTEPRPRTRIALRVSAIAIALAVALATFVLPVAGHPDPPATQQPGSIFTSVELSDVCITEAKQSSTHTWKWGCSSRWRGRNPGPLHIRRRVYWQEPADGFDQNAEMVVIFLVHHDDHVTLFIKKFEKDDLRKNPWVINEQFYSHDECSTRSDLKTHVIVFEIDSSTSSQVLGEVAEAFAATAYGRGAGAAVAVAGILNGNDHFGGLNSDSQGEVPFTDLIENGSQTLEFSGGDGKGKLNLLLFTGESPVFESECAFTPSPSPSPTSGLPPPPTPSPSPSPSEPAESPEQKTGLIYDPLERGLHMLPGSCIPVPGRTGARGVGTADFHPCRHGAERGNPAGFGRRALAAMGAMSGSFILGLAEGAAGLAIEDARHNEGTQEAIEWFLAGREQGAAGDADGALAAFRKSFLAATIAKAEAVDSGGDYRLPLHLTAAPSVLVPNSEGIAHAFVSAFGADQPPEFVVEGAPEGIEVVLVPEEDVAHTYLVRTSVSGDVAPGLYPITLVAFDGEVSSETQLFVSITRTPRLGCKGFSPHIVGTRGSDELTGSRRHEVIVARKGDDVIRGRGRDDLICAGGGDDLLKGGSGEDTLLGGRGRDKCIGGRGQDAIFISGKQACEKYR